MNATCLWLWKYSLNEEGDDVHDDPILDPSPNLRTDFKQVQKDHYA